MNFKNTKPTAADFFRKYADLVSEAEESSGDKAVDKDIKKLAKDQKKDVSDYKKEKDSDEKKDKLAESSNYYKQMMGESHEGFAAVEKSVAKNPKVKDPGAVAASIGRKKYGKEKFQKMAAAGKKEESCNMEESRDLKESRFEISYTLKNGEKKKKIMVGSDKDKVSKYFKFKYRHDVDNIRELPKVEESKQIQEKWEEKVELNPKKKGMFKGKTKGELEKQEKNLVKSGPHKKGSPEYTKEKELNFAICANGDWGKGKTESRGVKESSGYESSADFEEAASELQRFLNEAVRILKSPQWKNWMRATDTNYSPATSASQMSAKIAKMVQSADLAYDELYSMLSNLD